MSTFSEMQELWQQATPGPQPGTAAIKQLVLRSQKRLRVKNLLGVLSLLATTAVLVWILIGFHPVYFSTRIGIVLVLIAVAGAIVLNVQLLGMLKSAAITTDNATSLKAMLCYQEKAKFFYSRGISAYFLLLTGGLSLYMYEFTHRSWSFTIIAYSLTLAWIAFAWFHLRPRTIRKQTAKMNELIAHLQKLQESWDD